MSEPVEGGTKINRRPPQNVQQNYPPPQQQMVPQQPQNYPPPQQQRNFPQQRDEQPEGRPLKMPTKLMKKSTFGAENINFAEIKNALLVVLIFMLLNSKMIWKQITKLPFMGTLEPSMIALIVNSILAGIFFYLLSNFFMNN
jgi:hypothetical protein